MYPGTTLIDDLTIYSQSFPREADNLKAVFQIMDIGATGSSVAIKAYTKNSTDGAWPLSTDPVGTTATLNSSALATATQGLVTLTVSSAVLKEEVRFGFVGTAGSGKWVHFRLVELVWYDEAVA